MEVVAHTGDVLCVSGRSGVIGRSEAICPVLQSDEGKFSYVHSVKTDVERR